MKNEQQLLLKIKVKSESEENILDNIKKYIISTTEETPFFHIVSLNPENVVIAHEDLEFRDVLNQGSIQLIDGVGILLGCSILGIRVRGRFSGVDCMEKLLQVAGEQCLRVLFLGGRPQLANKLTDCYQKKYPTAFFKGIYAISDIKKPSKKEENEVMAIVAQYKPHIIFAAFGSPYQELWFWRHRDQFKGIVCMGVGGAFDYLGGEVPRAPHFLRVIGLEWLFRLMMQPWRIGRQLRLVRFLYLVVRQKINLL